jgi:hypothetical protein
LPFFFTTATADRETCPVYHPRIYSVPRLIKAPLRAAVRVYMWRKGRRVETKRERGGGEKVGWKVREIQSFDAENET